MNIEYTYPKYERRQFIDGTWKTKVVKDEGIKSFKLGIQIEKKLSSIRQNCIGILVVSLCLYT